MIFLHKPNLPQNKIAEDGNSDGFAEYNEITGGFYGFISVFSNVKAMNKTTYLHRK